ncbi:ABC transporter ATP-binding protein, partial [Enterococcus faecalis]|nr:ABC transporter ATP-binding protein [Enterococcus faecalis]
MKKIVEVNHVSKTYGRLNKKTELLDNISFPVDEGEFVG